MGLRHSGQMVNFDPQSLQVCNEITLVKKIAIPCKSGRGEKHKYINEFSSAHQVPTAKGQLVSFRKTYRADLYKQIGRK